MSDRYQAYDDYHSERSSRPNGRARAFEDAFDDPVFGDDETPPEPDDMPPPMGERINVNDSAAPLKFKSAAAFADEYVPLAYTVEPIIRSSSLYTLTAKTGAGKTALNIVAALAVATGRRDILGRDIHKGRVAYIACENPDDIRMRLKIAAYLLNIDLRQIGERLVILDMRAKPEAVHAALKQLAEQEPFALVIVDTLAAFFDGDNINDAVQGGQFMRRLRPLTQIGGLPSVIVAAHPIKNAGEESLVPYGSGAILNEVDGNLTLWKKAETGLVSLHWQGKLRGIEFEPLAFRFEITGCPEILDAKGREVLLPTMRPASEESTEDRERKEADIDRALIEALAEDPGASYSTLAAAVGLKSKSGAEWRLKKLARDKLVAQTLGKWTVTAKGKKAIGGDQ